MADKKTTKKKVSKRKPFVVIHGAEDLQERIAAAVKEAATKATKTIDLSGGDDRAGVSKRNPGEPAYTHDNGNGSYDVVVQLDEEMEDFNLGNFGTRAEAIQFQVLLNRWAGR